MTRLARSLDQIADTYYVIIVGSGYGGGVSASRLSRAGKRVAVLERGREFVTGEFPARFPDLRNELQVTTNGKLSGKESALYDVRVGRDMHVLVGCGLGGGSLVNAGVALRPDPRVFEDSAWPGQIRQDSTLDEGYARADAWLRPSAHQGAGDLTKYKALSDAAEELGETVIAPRVVVSFEDTVNAAGIAQPGCTLCGDCCGGCNVGAKNTVALTYLPDAVRHGAELYTHTKVRQVRKGKDGHWQIDLARLDLNAKGKTLDGNVPERPEEFTISAPVVILAAGTLGSTEILLRSAEAGLKVSGRLGQRFSANGDIIAFGYGAKPEINAVGIGHPKKLEGVDIGASVSGQIEVHDPDNLENQLCVQEGVLPSSLAPVLPMMFLPNGRIVGALQSLINGVYKGQFAHLQTFFAVSHDSGSGEFKLENDRLALAWPGAKDEPVYKRLDDMLKGIVTTAGGSYVKNPLAGTVMGHQPATALPLGGCGMGTDSADGVVNHKGQVFDGGAGDATTAVHSGLYVIDGSIIPRSLGCNPLFTITALSERAMIHFAADHGLKFNTDPIEVAEPTTPFAPAPAAAMA